VVVTDNGKVLKPMSAREKSVKAKEKWKAAAAKGGKGESSTKEGVNKGKVGGETTTMKAEKAGHVNKEALTKEVVSTKKAKMKWKAAVAKQGVGRNGYKPIMTDNGFVVGRKDSTGGLKPTKNTREKKDPSQIINNFIKIKENTVEMNDSLASGLDEVDGSEFKQSHEKSSREKEKALRKEKEEKNEEGRKKKRV